MKQALARIGRQSPAMVVAMLALFVALSGTAVATTAAVVITGKQIKNASITGLDVKNKSLTARDFKGSVRGPRGLRGLTGAKGDPGATGATGAPGAPGAPGAALGTPTVQVEEAIADLADGGNQSYNAFCPAGQQGIAGGGRGDATNSEATILTSLRPAMSAGNTEPPVDGGSFTGWRITVVNPTGGVTTGIRPQVWVVCVPAAP